MFQESGPPFRPGLFSRARLRPGNGVIYLVGRLLADLVAITERWALAKTVCVLARLQRAIPFPGNRQSFKVFVFRTKVAT